MDILNIKKSVLSMPKSRKRRAFMDLKLKNLGIKEYSYFDALDGIKFKDRNHQYILWCKNNGVRPMVGGVPVFGCLMSFCDFFQKCEDEPQILFEDDIYFHKDFWTLVDSLPGDLLGRYDLVYLGYNNFRISDRQREAIERNDILIPVETHNDFCTYGGYGILYSREAIRFFKQIFVPDMPHERIQTPDYMIWLHGSRHLRCCIINPPLVVPDVRQSNIRDSQEIKQWCDKRLIKLEDYELVDEFSNYSGLD